MAVLALQSERIFLVVEPDKPVSYKKPLKENLKSVLDAPLRKYFLIVFDESVTMAFI